eukprot:TRINITY_DN12989_c0_g1_i2.p1 TRINITY_DN12989_c0_g1~~TRINITY_DN12989_c0_g1_i2.p1  ORF type:complete len:435 (-),score=103.84 TRINITY_DN12989_c0_g1_i2:50-1354(-)
MTMIYFCTLGGAMTYVGDPPNLIIGSRFGLSFNAFLVNCSPCVLAILPFALLLMFIQFRKRMRLIVKASHAAPELQNLPKVPAAESLSVISRPHRKGMFRRWISSGTKTEGDDGHTLLAPTDNEEGAKGGGDPEAGTELVSSPSSGLTGPEAELKADEENDAAGGGDENEDDLPMSDPIRTPATEESEVDADVIALMESDVSAASGTMIMEEFALRDKRSFIKCIVVLMFILIGFVLEPVTNLSASYVSVVGAGVLLLITHPRDITAILEKVEWPTLLFFSYLFIFIRLTEQLSLTYTLTKVAEKLIMAVPERWRLPIAVIAIVWMSGNLACWCNNIAFTVTIIPLIYQIGYNPAFHCPLRPLAWSLSLGVAMSANGTLIAAAPNLIVSGIAARAGHKLSFLRFMGWGFPFMTCTLVLVTLYCLFVYCVLGWQN